MQISTAENPPRKTKHEKPALVCSGFPLMNRNLARSKAFHGETDAPDWGATRRKKHDTRQMLILEQISNSRLASTDSDLQEETGTLRVLCQEPTDNKTGRKDRVDGGLGTMKDSASTEREIVQEVREGPRSRGLERRRHSRHRLGQPMQVWLEDGWQTRGMWPQATGRLRLQRARLSGDGL
jgi:hypothetical protein